MALAKRVEKYSSPSLLLSLLRKEEERGIGVAIITGFDKL